MTKSIFPCLHDGFAMNQKSMRLLDHKYCRSVAKNLINIYKINQRESFAKLLAKLAFR